MRGVFGFLGGLMVLITIGVLVLPRQNESPALMILDVYQDGTNRLIIDDPESDYTQILTPGYATLSVQQHDGEWVYYIAGNNFYRVRLRDQRVELLLEDTESVTLLYDNDPAWLYFSRPKASGGNGIYRKRVRDGYTEEITPPTMAFGDRPWGTLQVLSGRRGFLYATGAGELYWTDWHLQEQRLLATFPITRPSDIYGILMVLDDWVLFNHGGTVQRVRLDGTEPFQYSNTGQALPPQWVMWTDQKFIVLRDAALTFAAYAIDTTTHEPLWTYPVDETLRPIWSLLTIESGVVQQLSGKGGQLFRVWWATGEMEPIGEVGREKHSICCADEDYFTTFFENETQMYRLTAADTLEQVAEFDGIINSVTPSPDGSWVYVHGTNAARPMIYRMRADGRDRQVVIAGRYFEEFVGWAQMVDNEWQPIWLGLFGGVLMLVSIWVRWKL